MKQKIYIDFDSTLFDSDKYDLILEDICNKYGISKDKLTNIKKSLFDKNTDFDLDCLLSHLLNVEFVNKEIIDDVERLKKKVLLYEETIDFLKLAQKNYELILLTCGQEKNQYDKIRACQIESYFSEIIITSGDKSKLKNVDYINGVFIDNNPSELIKFFNVGAKKVIRIKRQSDKYSIIEMDISEIDEFDNLLDILNNLSV